jgi:hypothetical protein
VIILPGNGSHEHLRLDLKGGAAPTSPPADKSPE